MLAGHFFAHIPQPTHLSELTMALVPVGIDIASSLQAVRQQPHATHSFLLIIAFFFIV
jgi:hypothetical protein